MSDTAAAHDVGRVIDPRFAARIVKERHALEAHEGVCSRSDLLGSLLLRQRRVVSELRSGEGPFGRASDEFRHVYEAADGAQDALGVEHGGRVALHVAHDAPRGDGGFGVRVHTRGPADGIGVDAADRSNAFRSVGLHPLGEIRKPHGRCFYERVVVQILFDDDVDPCEQQRRIGSVSDAKVLAGEQRRIGFSRVDLDELCPARECGFEFEVFHGPELGPAVLPEVDDEIGFVPVRARVPSVHRPMHLSGVAHAQKRGRDVVRRSQVVHKATGDASESGVQGHLRNRKRFGPVGVDDRGQAICYLVERLIPFDFLPNGIRAFPDVLTRLHHAIGMAAVLAPQMRLRADGGQVRVKRRNGDLAIVSNGDGTASVAEHARAVPGFPRFDFSHENPLSRTARPVNIVPFSLRAEQAFEKRVSG